MQDTFSTLLSLTASTDFRFPNGLTAVVMKRDYARVSLTVLGAGLSTLYWNDINLDNLPEALEIIAADKNFSENAVTELLDADE